MTRLLLGEPVLDSASEQTRFFNGRLLTGADLAREQAARSDSAAAVAQAVGNGIVSGLDVVRSVEDRGERFATVTIRAGVAISRSGRTLRLGAEQRLALVRDDSSDFSSPSDTTFATCAAPAGGSYVAGEGLYLLTMGPATVPTGRAQVNGLPSGDAACNVDIDRNGVCFRLIEIRSFLYGGLTPDDPSFRNRIAYRCFGPRVTQPWAATLFAQSDSGTGLLDSLPPGAAPGPDEVPLALVAFAGALDIVFIDNWAARRPVSLPDATAALPALSASARPATGRAMLQQFQDHLADLAAGNATLAGVTAASHFPTLPPLGLLPGMDETTARAFLAGKTLRGPVHINAAQLEGLVRESLSSPAIDGAEQGVVWLYAVAENLFDGARRLADARRPDPYLIFARGDLAYRGDARINLHRWNYANFALGGS